MGRLLTLLGKSRPATAAVTVLPTLTGSNYVDVRSNKGIFPGFTGSVFQLGCATGMPSATLNIGQTPSHEPDLSNELGWSGGSAAVFFEGYTNQVTGTFTGASSSGKRPLYLRDANENGLVTASFGQSDTGSNALSMGLPSETLSVDRADIGVFVVCRTLGAGLTQQQASLNTSVPAANLSLGGTPGNKFTLYSFGSQNGFTAHLPPINQLAVLGYVGTAAATKLHVNDRVTTTTANSASAVVTAYLGRNTTSTSSSTLMDAVAIVTVSPAPSDVDAQAIKNALYEIFGISTAPRKNVLVVCPHSLAFNANTAVYNQTCWKQMMPLLTKRVEIGLIGQSGKQISQQITELSDLTNVYEAGIDRMMYGLGSAVNDVNGLTSGFANGDSLLITAAATTIYNRYVSLNDSLVAQGPNVRVIVATGWPPLSAFWSGTAQDKADKAQVLLEVNQMKRDGVAAKGWSISDEATINTSGGLGDSVHTNRVGEGRRAVIQAPVVDNLAAA